MRTESKCEKIEFTKISTELYCEIKLTAKIFVLKLS